MEVSIATSVRYGGYKQHYSKALGFEEVIKDYEVRMRKVINLPANIDVVLRPIRRMYGRASFRNKHFKVEIDIRQTYEEFKNTLLHELVHIEQFFEGRLSNDEQGELVWYGKRYRVDMNNLTAYVNLPWEEEAFRRASNLKKYLF
jgi:hypothetical protein